MWSSQTPPNTVTLLQGLLHVNSPGRPTGTLSILPQFFYDDSDNPEPEQYAAVCAALKRQDDRIVDVIIVQRPSMIRNRNACSF